MNKPKLSIRPPLKEDRDRALEDFITAPIETKVKDFPSARTSEQEKKPAMLPWEHDSVREELIKVFNLRLSEPLFLKLQYLSDVKRISKHQICLQIIEQKIEEMLSGIS